MRQHVKYLTLSIFFIGILFPISLYSQSNNIKAIEFSIHHLQPVFAILRTQPELASPPCMESLKKIHFLKDEMKNNATHNSQDINESILRSLYNDALEFCEVDAKNICIHTNSLSIQTQCKTILH